MMELKIKNQNNIDIYCQNNNNNKNNDNNNEYKNNEKKSVARAPLSPPSNVRQG